MSVGAVAVSGSETLSGVVPVTPFTVTLIVVAPGSTAVTLPSPLTVATAGSLLA
jgi:hypothetical protein